jgi:hypothetical protein
MALFKLGRILGKIALVAREQKITLGEMRHSGPPRRSAVPGRQPELQSENVMGGLCLGIAITGVEALVAMGLVIAFM